MPDAHAAAPAWRRLAAGLYDLLPMAALWMAATAAWIALAQWLWPEQRAALESYGRWAVANWAFRAWLLGVTCAYYAGSWAAAGQTIGMRAWGLRVARADGRRLGAGAALLRFVVALAGVAAFGIGLWWAWLDPRRRMLHDLVANSEVRHLPSR
jgi:uncharacterized RDD family membrane protein YckC